MRLDHITPNQFDGCYRKLTTLDKTEREYKYRFPKTGERHKAKGRARKRSRTDQKPKATPDKEFRK